MNLERIIRPFQSGEVLATKRIVKSTAVATGETAFLSWGAAGTLPKGIMQFSGKPSTSPAAAGGFKVVDAQKTWTQTGTPVTEEVDLGGGAKAKRVREITFNTINDAPSGLKTAPFGSAVTDIVAGLKRDIEGSRVSSATYKTKWD